jgi:hypothetical protein
MLLLRTTSPTGKERHYDALIGGLVGGYTIFARDIRSSVAQQIVIYVAARVVLAVGKLAVQNGGMGTLNGGREAGWGSKSQGWRKVAARNGWPAAATLSWGLVMYIFRWHPEAVQPSLRSSMSYMWVTPPESPLLLSLSWEKPAWCGLSEWVGICGRKLMFVDSYVQSDHWDSLRNFIWHNK